MVRTEGGIVHPLSCLARTLAPGEHEFVPARDPTARARSGADCYFFHKVHRKIFFIIFGKTLDKFVILWYNIYSQGGVGVVLETQHRKKRLPPLSKRES